MPRRVFHEKPVQNRTKHQSVINPWYVTGFCDGEAAFTYSLDGSGLGLTLYFSLKLHERDRALLEEIQDYFGVGEIYNVKLRYPGANRNSAKIQVFYRVSAAEDHQRIIAHFDRYPLQGGKARGYQVWRQIAILKWQHYGHPPQERIVELARELSRLNSSNRSAILREADERNEAEKHIPGEHVSVVTDPNE